MKIIIDCRESGLLETFRQHYSNVEFESGNLEVADIIIMNDSGQRILIERKTLKDLSSSIRDGRYKEQAERLSKSCEESSLVFYLIEGSTKSYTKTNSKYSLPLSTLISAMFTLSTEYRFSLYRTNDIRESADWLNSIASKFNKERKNPTLPAYGTLIKKSSSITKDNIECIMLAQVPGISSSTAAQVLLQTGGLMQLLTMIKSEPDALDGLRVKTNTGKDRKFSKNCITNLRALLG